MIYDTISTFFDGDEPVFTEDPLPKDTAPCEDDSEAVALIKEILETRIKPIVQEDGGDIEFSNFEEDTGKVWVVLKGACTDCPSSTATLKGGIERMLTHYVAEVTEVLAEDYVQD